MAQPVAQAAKKAIRTFRELHGVVISAGLMDKTVKVRVGGQKWNSFLKKVRFIIYHLPRSISALTQGMTNPSPLTHSSSTTPKPTSSTTPTTPSV
jgi:hypothetical protein